MKKIRLIMTLPAILLLAVTVQAQNTQLKDSLLLNIDTLFKLVTQNNPSLKVLTENTEVARQNIDVTKTKSLPTASISVSAYYISNTELLETDFSPKKTQEMPHFGNAAKVDINQVIWKGGQIKEEVNQANIRYEIESYTYLSSEQQAKLTALNYYLELFRIYNQKRVYTNNIELAKHRLKNSTNFFNQGMVTRNDVIRSELQLSNLKLQLLSVENNIDILNKQLSVALGLPQTTRIIPDSSLLKNSLVFDDESTYQNQAKATNPNILLNQKNYELYSSKLNQAIKNYYPALNLFAGNTLQRPITSTSPAIDMYYNNWNAGASLSWNISSLWNNKRTINLSQAEINKVRAKQIEIESNIEISVQSVYIKHNEAITQKNTLEINQRMAEENYRITENKYNNQTALFIDLIDASNLKLEAELQYINSEINIIYAYYNLLKEIGKL